MLTGENGILTQANNAKEQTEIAEEKEQIELAYISVLSDKKTENIEANDLEQAL